MGQAGRHNLRPRGWLILRCACLLCLFGLLACGRPARQEEGEVERLTVTVREGERMRDFCARLEERKVTTCAALRELAARYPLAEYPFVPPRDDRLNRFEGVFRPGAYTVTIPAAELRSTRSPGVACSVEFHGGEPRFSGSCVEELEILNVRIARRIVDQLIRAVADRYTPASAPNNLSLQEQMILASIVEKEAVANRDYDLVAAVFHNRLRRNMTLGSCPTVEYALGFHRPFLLFKDLEIASPYNVYKRAGLPPTPIAFFSDGAFRAVREPSGDRELVFFVYDWTNGKLFFAADYRKHVKFAITARENFIREFGKENMYKKFPDKFYEPIR